MTRWIYIMGRGHSGSTMLDAVLGNAPQIESIGELMSGMGRYDALCSCGAAFEECTFWRRVRRQFEDASGANWERAVTLCTEQAHVARFLPTLISRRRAPRMTELRDLSVALADAIAAEREFVVDSSKEFSRALFLLRMVAGTVVIHLVRHPQGVLSSNLRRLQNGHGFKFMRRRFEGRHLPGIYLFISAVAWLIGNLLAELVTILHHDKVLRIRYEDFVTDPVREVSRLEEVLGVRLQSLRDALAENREFDVGHNVGGNYMRLSGRFHLDPDKARHAAMPRRYGSMIRVVCWPLMLRYGYR